MSANEIPAPVTRGEFTNHSVTTEDSSATGHPAAIAMLSAVMWGAKCRTVTTVCRYCRPDDVRLLDPSVGTALDVALELATQGRQPDPNTLNAELLRRGLYEGRAGELVRVRVIAATSPSQYAERLPEFAAAVLADVYRARLAAAGAALSAGAGTAPEDDLWLLLEGEGRAVRAVRNSLAALRKAVGAQTRDEVTA